MPTATPVTTPVLDPTVATAGLVLLHVPPGVASVSVTVRPTQTLDGPDMAAGEAFTVIAMVT